jgi:GAF domain-containing protein
MTEIDAILEELRAKTGAGRVTLRQDVPGDVFPVTHEALGDGALPIRGVATPDMARQPVVLQVQQGKQVVQDDCRAASDEPHFRTMIELYGGLRAQIVTPIVRDGQVVAIVSVHQLERMRHWTNEEIGAARNAVERIEALL